MFAFLLAVFCAFVRLGLIREACERIAYLLCYIFVANFLLHRSFTAAIVLLATTLVVAVVLSVVIVVAITVSTATLLIGSRVNIHALSTTDAVAFFLFSVSVLLLVFALLAAFFLRFLLGTRGGIDSCQVDSAEHLRAL